MIAKVYALECGDDLWVQYPYNEKVIKVLWEILPYECRRNGYGWNKEKRLNVFPIEYLPILEKVLKEYFEHTEWHWLQHEDQFNKPTPERGY